MPLSDEENRFYQQTLQMSRRQIEEIDEKIEQELAVVRERLSALQARRRAAWQMHDAACTMLGIKNDLGGDEAQDADSM